MAAVKIRKSVGKKGKNAVDDVKKIQELLNTHASKAGFKKLTVDMDVGTKTIGAIEAFQKKVVGMSRPDGRVDPGGSTLAALNAKPGSAPAKAEDAKGGSGSSSKSSSKSGSSSKSKSKSEGSKSKGSKSGGGKGKRDLKTVEKELEAVAKQYMDAGDRLRAAGDQMVEADEDIKAREKLAKDLDSSEKILKGFQAQVPSKLELLKEAVKAADAKRKRDAASKLADTGRESYTCIGGMTQANPLFRLRMKDCHDALEKEISGLMKIVEDDSLQEKLDTIDKAASRIDRSYKAIYAAFKVARGLNGAAIVANKAKLALFKKGADAAEKDMKKIKKELDRLSAEREKLKKSA